MAKTNPSKPKDTKAQDTLVAPNTQITVTIPWKTVQTAYDHSIQAAAKHVQIPGFRKGKVPPNLAEQSLDQNKVLGHVLDHVFPAAYQAALTDAKKHPISQPEIDPISMEKGQDWSFTVYFAEKPEVKLGNYQKLVGPAKKAAQKELEEVEKKLAADAKKPAKDAKTDEKTEPKTLTDAQKEEIQLKHIFKALIETIKPKIPELLVRSQVNRDLQRLAEQLQQLKVRVEDYLKSRQITVEQLRHEYAEMALGSLQLEFILAEIAKDQKLTVSDQEVDKRLEEVFEGKLTDEQRKNTDYRAYMFSTLLKQKVVRALLSVQ